MSRDKECLSDPPPPQSSRYEWAETEFCLQPNRSRIVLFYSEGRLCICQARGWLGGGFCAVSIKGRHGCDEGGWMLGEQPLPAPLATRVHRGAGPPRRAATPCTS
jgi:hypothetical protein